MGIIRYPQMSLRRYESSPTALPDLYGMYNPFAYPAEYTQSMANRLMSMMDDSVQRGLTRYFKNNQIPELSLVDKGNEFQIVSNVYGYTPSDLTVEHKDGFITVSGKKEKSDISPDQQSYSQSFSSFTKTIRAPSKAKNINASLQNGFLTISIPK